MRHQTAGRKFNRTSAHRSAMFSNMAASLFKIQSHTTDQQIPDQQFCQPDG